MGGTLESPRDMLSKITPLILTYNEAPNIERALSRLGWAERVVVVDSLSADGTPDILKRFPKVEIFQRRFDDHASQWNFGLDQVATEWVLALDADYLLTDEFVAELRELQPNGVGVYAASFKYVMFGRRLKASLYPPRPVLFRKNGNRYYQDGHTQKLKTGESPGRLSSFIDHDDRKSLSSWLEAQDRYALLEAKKLGTADWAGLPLQDKLRKLIVPAPFVAFFYTLLVKGMICEGWAGWYYVFQRTTAEILLSLRLIEAKANSEGE